MGLILTPFSPYYLDLIISLWRAARFLKLGEGSTALNRETAGLCFQFLFPIRLPLIRETQYATANIKRVRVGNDAMRLDQL